ncbi:MAG: thiamine pyrophosphate-dependent enzyme [Thermoguttaceae bacterium]
MMPYSSTIRWLPDGAEVHCQTLWGSIGWATGATLGIALADPSRRTVLFTGEGSHQLTAADVGTMGRSGLKPIIFVLNNEGYMVERALETNPDLCKGLATIQCYAKRSGTQPGSEGTVQKPGQ